MCFRILFFCFFCLRDTHLLLENQNTDNLDFVWIHAYAAKTNMGFECDYA